MDRKVFDERAVHAADAVVDAAIKQFIGLAGATRAVVVTAPAGAGKSSLVCRAVGAARKKKLRVAVLSPTNEQAFGLTARLAAQHPRQTISFLPRNNLEIPTEVTRHSNVAIVTPEKATRSEVVVGTLSKLGDSLGRGQIGSFDVMLVDESYQANAAQYYAIGNLAPTHLLVGDGGQLSPFSTIKDADHWRGLQEDPLQTAVGVLLRNHKDTPVHKLPITRRLDARAAPIAQAFYADLPFGAAVRPGVRKLALASAKKRLPVDDSLDLAASKGWAYITLPDALTLSADPDILQTIVSIVERLAVRKARIRDERFTEWTEPRIAVGVSHNDQKDQLRASLQTAGYAHVVVDTANKLQGLEFDIVIAWHPLSGLPEADEFHLDPGRLCVLLTRHRHACIVIGRDGDRKLVEGVPPKSPSYVGWDSDPLLDGWAVHEDVFRLLEPYKTRR